MPLLAAYISSDSVVLRNALPDENGNASSCSFVNGGRGAFVYGDSDFDLEKTSAHVLNAGQANVSVSSASIFGMGCGWRADAPGGAGDRVHGL